jgi:nucleoside-diphosphate kinase
MAYQNNHQFAVKCDAVPVQGVPGTNRERTFLAVKPDGVQRGLIGDIIARFEKRGYKVCHESVSINTSNILSVAPDSLIFA